ncbi:MAG: hypothetical protein V1793_08970 [Pseudomonadota bacterium]
MGAFIRISIIFLLCVCCSGASAEFEPNVVGYPGSTEIYFWGVNDDGIIVGVDAQGMMNQNNFIYDGTSFTTLEMNFPEGGEVRGINNAGNIVGEYCTGDLVVNGILPPHACYGFIYNGTAFDTFQFPGAMITHPMGINSANAVVGYYQLTFLDNVTHGFLLDAQGFHTIDYPGEGNTTLRGINDSGEIIGEFKGTESSLMAFLYYEGKFTIISAPDSRYTSLSGIDNQGRIAGWYYEDGPGSVDATAYRNFLYENEEFIPIEPPGPTFMELMGISPSTRQLVGTFYRTSYRGTYDPIGIVFRDQTSEDKTGSEGCFIDLMITRH